MHPHSSGQEGVGTNDARGETSHEYITPCAYHVPIFSIEYVEMHYMTPPEARYESGMILKNHTYLKVYKCWRILPILKTPTIKCLAIFFKKYFNFQGFYIVDIIIWQFLG